MNTFTRSLMIITLILMPAPALAATSFDTNAATQDTVFYAPQDDCTSAPGGTTTTVTDTSCCPGASAGLITLVGKDLLEQAMNAFISNLGLTPTQAAGIVGNLMWESGGGVTLRPNADELKGIATTPTNGDGFGIAQWTFTARQQPLVSLAQKNSVPVDALAVQLQYVIDELTNNQIDAPGVADYSAALTDLKKQTDVTAATTSFMNNYEAPGVPAFNNRLSGAQAVLSQFSGSASGAGTLTGGAIGGCGAVAGNGTGIVGTALEFAWPKPDCAQTFKDSAGTTETRSSCFDGTLAYQKGWDKAGGDPPMTDCGAFISSVMIDSKADPNYPRAGTLVQYPYVKNNPKLYKIINTKSTSGLQPGDILVAANEADGSGHTAFYMGSQPGYDGFVAAASWGGHTPQMDGGNSAGEVAFILADGAPYGAAAARYIGTTAQVYKP